MTTSLRRKLGLEPEMRVFVADMPATVRDALGLPADAGEPRLAGAFDFVHVFVDDGAALDTAFRRLRPHLAPGGRLWVSWRKGGRGGDRLRLPEVIRIGYDHGLVESKTVSVDATWSAMKFTHPKPGKQYRNSYGRLPDGA